MPESLSYDDLVDETSEIAESFNGNINDLARAVVPEPELKVVRSQVKQFLGDIGNDLTQVATMIAEAREAHAQAEPEPEPAPEPEKPKRAPRKRTTAKGKGGSKAASGKGGSRRKAAVPA